MDKRTQAACEVLQQQIEKTKSPEFVYDKWRLQSKSLIKEYFGEDSDEYAFFNRRVFADAGYEERRPTEVERAKGYVDFLKTSIDTLKVKGIKKEERKNLLSKISEGWLIFWAGVLILGIFPALFYSGYWFGERSKTTQKTELPTTPIITNKISKDISYDTKDTSKDNQINK